MADVCTLIKADDFREAKELEEVAVEETNRLEIIQV